MSAAHELLSALLPQLHLQSAAIAIILRMHSSTLVASFNDGGQLIIA